MQVDQVIEVLDLSVVFDFIAIGDADARGKPDPEIYDLVDCELGIPAHDCLVTEHSPAGVEAALAAGMQCIAVTTPFTRNNIHRANLLDDRWIVDEPE